MSFLNSIKSGFATAGVRLGEAGPAIGTTAGVVGIGATAYLASRATLKAGAIMDEHKENIKTMDAAYDLHKEGAKAAADYDANEYARDHAQVWVNTVTKFAKLYSPAILVGVGSAALIIASHRTMSNRLSALTAAYTVLQNTFAAYRERVEEHFGKEEVDKVVTDREAIKKQVETRDLDDHEVDYKTYARIFGRGKGTNRYVDDAHSNVTFLSSAENYFNERLNARGFVFLNEVYEHLGYESVPGGQSVGWLSSHRIDELAQKDLARGFDRKEDYGYGDGCIDFGIFESHLIEKRMELATDLEWGEGILLTFNIDPYFITDKI